LQSLKSAMAVPTTCRRTTFVSCSVRAWNRRIIIASSRFDMWWSIVESRREHAAPLVSDTTNECGQRSQLARSKRRTFSRIFRHRSKQDCQDLPLQVWSI